MEREKPRIDPEFAALLPKPTPERVNDLLKQLEAEGCRDPLVVWSEENIIVDGHTRFDLCEIRRIPYEVTYLDFDSRDAVFDWMCANQLSRRNLTDDERAYFIGKQYLQKKKTHGGQVPGKGDSTSESPSPKTAEIIAKANKVSTGTVHTDAKFAEAVDAHEKAKPGSKEKILRGEAGPKKKVIETAPILCQRCKQNGPARNCRWCAEEADKKRAEKAAKKKDDPPFIDHRKLPVAPQVESEENDLLTSCEKGGGHPFLELMKEVTALSKKLTKAMKGESEDSVRLYKYFIAAGLVDHAAKDNAASFLPLKGVVKVMDLAGGGGKELSEQNVRNQYAYACGEKVWIPPLTKRRRDAKKARR